MRIVRLLICGSRTWDDPDPITALIVGYGVLARRRSEPFLVIHGACRTGADAWAVRCAHRFGINTLAVPADWDTAGRAAGPQRNQRIIGEHRPDTVWAFRAHGPSAGTDDMIGRATRAGLPTYVVHPH